ncbi:MAG: DNA-directed DNA polymerase I [Candidatus Bathyarchaeia archaeon]
MIEKTLEDFLDQEDVVGRKTAETPRSRLEACASSTRAYLLSATYDGKKGLALLKFYEPYAKKISHWYDNTGHKPYCLCNLSPEALMEIPAIKTHEGLDHIERTTKIDPFTGEEVQVTKIVAKDPLSIGGKPSGSIRDIIPSERPQDSDLRVWEANIKYYESYLYDTQLEIGMPYRLEGSNLVAEAELSHQLLQQIDATFRGEPTEFMNYVKNWIRLLECPVPDLRFVALDIEVESPALNRIPDPREALYPVICASAVDSDGNRRVLLLERLGVEEGTELLPERAQVLRFDEERKLIVELCQILREYPIVVTFNGDDFDLRYIWHRAQRLGVPDSEVPIELGKETALLTYGVHIDLYKFFYNRSIQVYAFDQKYRETTLHDIAFALLGVGKIKLERNISALTNRELMAYCLRDSELTYGLASLDGNLTLKLALALARISKMPLEDVTRQGVSNWIRSMMYAEHRQRGFLIPTSEEILARKGVMTTEAVIKGKKYRGAIVIEPKPGVNFNVYVLDFSSLYPSIIKRWNLSYETILCPHEDCKSNLIPGTPHWVCTKRQGLTSLLIGSLRDVRVKWYKTKAKDKTLKQEVRAWYSIVQRTLKVLLNASYGVFGAEHFALYCPPVAEATSAIGRYAITSTIAKAQELGIEVIYGDTDSVFLKNPSPDQIRQLVNWSKESLGMELDVEKVYRYSAFSTRKKNYIGVYPDGSVDIKGLIGKKRNTPEFLKSAFAQMIRILSEVRSEEEFKTAKERIKGIVKECYIKLKSKGYGLDELAFTVVLGKNLEEYEKTTPQHIKAMRFLSGEDREKVGAGSVIRYVKVRKDPSVKPVHLASLDEVDTEKYVEHIQATFEQVLDALGIDFNEIIGISRLERWV